MNFFYKEKVRYTYPGIGSVFGKIQGSQKKHFFRKMAGTGGNFCPTREQGHLKFIGRKCSANREKANFQYFQPNFFVLNSGPMKKLLAGSGPSGRDRDFSGFGNTEHFLGLHSKSLQSILLVECTKGIESPPTNQPTNESSIL